MRISQFANNPANKESLRDESGEAAIFAWNDEEISRIMDNSW